MPNWCDNTLTVHGDEDALKRFMAAVAEQPDADTAHLKDPTSLSVLSFHTILPCPQELLDTMAGFPVPKGEPERIAKYGAKDWYDWRVAHWGTKWDVCDPRLEYGDDTAVYEFETAWSPPRQLVEHLATVYPDLLFHLSYDEPSLDFGGYVVHIGGVQADILEGCSPSNAVARNAFADWKVDEWRETASQRENNGLLA